MPQPSSILPPACRSAPQAGGERTIMQGQGKRAHQRVNPFMLELFSTLPETAKKQMMSGKDQAWCGVFVHATLKTSGLNTLDQLPVTYYEGRYDENGRKKSAESERQYAPIRARDYKMIGTATNTPSLGDVVVRGNSHVGFVAGTVNKQVIYLGENQENEVRFSLYPRSESTFRSVIPSSQNRPPVQFGSEGEARKKDSTR